ncbi:MAG: hypothetical protein LBT09_13585 [Planctomycetaceae bacterium]|nr:hypothetical protein [Planctomycetaceae bacterium]
MNPLSSKLCMFLEFNTFNNETSTGFRLNYYQPPQPFGERLAYLMRLRRN